MEFSASQKIKTQLSFSVNICLYEIKLMGEKLEI